MASALNLPPYVLRPVFAVTDVTDPDEPESPESEAELIRIPFLCNHPTRTLQRLASTMGDLFESRGCVTAGRIESWALRELTRREGRRAA